jgi:hypothetical protein
MKTHELVDGRHAVRAPDKISITHSLSKAEAVDLTPF